MFTRWFLNPARRNRIKYNSSATSYWDTTPHLVVVAAAVVADDDVVLVNALDAVVVVVDRA